MRLLDKRQRDALRMYKSLEIDLDAVRKIFEERLQFSTGTVRRLTYDFDEVEENTIEVSPKDFETVLGKYLNGGISERQLSEWASFVHMCGLYYIAPNLLKASREVLLEVLSRLESTEINEKITVETVRRHLSNVRKLAR